MVYPHQLLARKASLRRIRMAATMHAKMSKKKLPQIDIIQICDTPKVPMALSLSNNLMGFEMHVMQSETELNQPHDEPTDNRQVRTLVQKSFKAALADNDMLISPAAPSAAYKIGEKKNDPLSMYAGDIMTVNVNLTGLPALVLPCGFVEGGPAGLPVDLQMIGSAFDEEMLLKVGHVFKSFPAKYGRMVCFLAILGGVVCLPCVSGQTNMTVASNATVNAIDKKVENFLAIVRALKGVCSWKGLLMLAAFMVTMIFLYNLALILKALTVQAGKCLPKRICKDPKASTGKQAGADGGNVPVDPPAGGDDVGGDDDGGDDDANLDAAVLASEQNSDLEAVGGDDDGGNVPV